MKKQQLFIVTGIIISGLVFGIYQYFQAFEVGNVSAVQIGTPNPGHTWAQMECSGDTLCIDVENKRLGIGTANPSVALEVNGSIKVGTGGNICFANGRCLGDDGVCGTKNHRYATTAPTGTEACAFGAIKNMSGSYSWICEGQSLGANVVCVTASEYTVVSYTNTANPTNWTVPAGVTSVEYLLVGGGAGGDGPWYGGGGGAGGVLSGIKTVTPLSTLEITVGAGGTAHLNGGNSTFADLVAIGGGAGGAPGSLGGSGGGGTSASVGGNGTSGQGYAGGTGYACGYQIDAGGGGGGAGAVGANASCNIAGNGGGGVANSITGVSTYYAGGGGGGGCAGLVDEYGDGGIGGGGQGKCNDCGGPATYYGGGGGGTSYGYCTGGSGYQGIVILKYLSPL
ncbi:MAG: glycine-rich domain-containing protein [Candidatus Paceibacterota bacterium]|jgi:hypothetical protein